MNRYVLTFSSGKPSWATTKWLISAESRSEAMHKALLIHDSERGFDVNMVTLSKEGAADVDMSDFRDLDTEEMQKQILVLNLIWNQKFNKMENV